MKEKINNLDISSILFLQLFSCSLGIAPYITIKITGIDAYISIIIGTIIGIIPILILIYIFNYEIDKPIHIKTKIIYGKTLGTIINIILTIIYIILTYQSRHFVIQDKFKNASAFLLRDARHAKHDIFLLRISAILPEAISDGGLTPTTDTNLLLAT